MVTSFADGTKISFEQAIVANATGMTVARRGMRRRWTTPATSTSSPTPTTSTSWRASAASSTTWSAPSPGPGVFVLATHDDPKQRHYLEPLQARRGPALQLLHALSPVPLRGAADASLAPCCSATPTIAPLGAPTVEVVTTAKRDLSGRRHARRPRRLRHLRPGRDEPTSTAAERPAADGRGRGLLGCARRAAKDQVLTYDDVELPAGRLVDRAARRAGGRVAHTGDRRSMMRALLRTPT